ncbi:MAG: hypothetical protein M3121_00505, partial [Chloroflexota bacterium]|nr:hypothetical protein [Chloroflexota bacterium]
MDFGGQEGIPRRRRHGIDKGIPVRGSVHVGGPPVASEQLTTLPPLGGDAGDRLGDGARGEHE